MSETAATFYRPSQDHALVLPIKLSEGNEGKR
jgi:hypothetical protein